MGWQDWVPNEPRRMVRPLNVIGRLPPMGVRWNVRWS
jgi:hypothetical protein